MTVPKKDATHQYEETIMYRAPNSGGASRGFLALILLTLGALYLSGCSDSATDPIGDDDPIVDPLELEIAIDPDLFTAATEEIESLLDPADPSSAMQEIQRANGLFAQAQSAFNAGDMERVQGLADEAREALALALLVSQGPGAVDGLVSSAEDVLAQLESGLTEEFDRATPLGDRIATLLDEARDAQAAGDDVRAAERTVLASQISDLSRARHVDGRSERGARFAVARGIHAVHLAERILNGQDLTERQVRMLRQATRLSEGAKRAFLNGRFRRAVMLANRAVVAALRAVVLPNLTEDEIRLIVTAAEAEIAAAAVALEAEPNDFLGAQLVRAKRAFAFGLERIQSGHPRGVVFVWYAAATAAVIAS